MILLGGVSFIYLDGKTSLESQKSFSKISLNESKSFIKLISNYKVLTLEVTRGNEVEDSLQKSLITSLDQIDYLQNSSQQKFKSKLVELIKLNKKLYEKRYQLEKLIIKERSRKLELEDTLSTEIVTRLKRGQEFMPGLKDTLAKWAQEVPFFKKIKNGLDVSYVDKMKFKELKSLMLLSKDLINSKYDLSTIDLDKYKFSKYLKVQVQISIELLNKATFVRKKQEEEIKNYAHLINTKIQFLDKIINDDFLISWQEYRLSQENLILAEKNKKQKLVLDTVALIGIFMILLLLIIFLKIFPYLSSLEKRAKEIAEGDFDKRFQDIPKNEIGKVMMAFNEMADDIALYIEEIKREREKQTELSDAIQNMKKLNAMGELASKMSHEIKNPISILKFCLNDALEFIEQGDISKAEEELQKSNQALERLSLLATKLGSKNQISEFEVIKLNNLVKEVIYLYGESGRFELNNSNNEIEIKGPKVELQSAISNLFDNALESSESTIFINISQDAKETSIEIRNEGDQLENPSKIFNNFYSTKSGPTRGLGLSIVKDIVNLSGGSITYRYVEGYHSFLMKLPIC
jgi:signal transduction histidine kinase